MAKQGSVNGALQGQYRENSWSRFRQYNTGLAMLSAQKEVAVAGEHETTRLCLQWLFANPQQLQGAHVMDYGTGSGVLAVAALLMGAASVVGCIRAE